MKTPSLRNIIDLVEGEVIDFNTKRKEKAEKANQDVEQALGLDIGTKYIEFTFFSPQGVRAARSLPFAMMSGSRGFIAKNDYSITEIRDALEGAGVLWKEEPFEFDGFGDDDWS